MTTKKLSPAQQRFLLLCSQCGKDGYRTPFLGNRDAGRAANAWYRTARSLASLELIVLRRSGDAEKAWLPEFAPQEN